jgi:hypothetical protein
MNDYNNNNVVVESKKGQSYIREVYIIFMLVHFQRTALTLRLHDIRYCFFPPTFVGSHVVGSTYILYLMF